MEQLRETSFKALAGEWIRYWRRQKDFSQSELAERANISVRHLSFAENGKTDLPRSTLIAVLKALDLPAVTANGVLRFAGFADHFVESEEIDRDVLESVRSSFLFKAPYPVYIENQYLDIVATNDAFDRIVDLLGIQRCGVGNNFNVVLSVIHPWGLRPYLRNWVSTGFHQIERLRLNMLGQDATDTYYLEIKKQVSQVPNVEDVYAAKRKGYQLGHSRYFSFFIDGVRANFSIVRSELSVVVSEDYIKNIVLHSLVPADENSNRWWLRLVNSI